MSLLVLQVEMAGSSIFDYVHQQDHPELAEHLGLGLPQGASGLLLLLLLVAVVDLLVVVVTSCAKDFAAAPVIVTVILTGAHRL